jgi:hypothetical protein
MIRQTLNRIRKLRPRHRRPRRLDTIGAPIVIDVDEFEAARRNPRVRETLDEWIETWLIEVASGRSVSGGEFCARLRIVVEYVGERAQV